MSRPTLIPIIFVVLFAACAREKNLATPAGEVASRQKVIREIQEFNKSYGFEDTGSFSHAAPEKSAYYRCYYTDKLRLPDSYHELKVASGTASGCKVDDRKYDVFFYPMEAVASKDARTTSSLAEATMERLTVVVAHEDFHQQKAIRRLPTNVEEASATLVGFLTAAEYAKSVQGEDSELYRNLAEEASRFEKKAEVVNSFHRRLAALYQDVKSKRIAAQAALSEKERLFAELEESCLAITPDPTSFNECPAVMNNAGLAFDHTYTKHYDLMYRLASAHGSDVRTFVETLRGLPARRWSERDAVAYLQGLAAR